ncbi:MAG: hypothetical protein Q9227_006054 [Pyrenula ochraceoflavens]
MARKSGGTDKLQDRTWNPSTPLVFRNDVTPERPVDIGEGIESHRAPCYSSKPSVREDPKIKTNPASQTWNAGTVINFQKDGLQGKAGPNTRLLSQSPQMGPIRNVHCSAGVSKSLSRPYNTKMPPPRSLGRDSYDSSTVKQQEDHYFGGPAPAQVSCLEAAHACGSEFAAKPPQRMASEQKEEVCAMPKGRSTEDWELSKQKHEPKQDIFRTLFSSSHDLTYKLIELCQSVHVIEQEAAEIDNAIRDCQDRMEFIHWQEWSMYRAAQDAKLTELSHTVSKVNISMREVMALFHRLSRSTRLHLDSSKAGETVSTGKTLKSVKKTLHLWRHYFRMNSIAESRFRTVWAPALILTRVSTPLHEMQVNLIDLEERVLEIQRSRVRASIIERKQPLYKLRLDVDILGRNILAMRRILFRDVGAFGAPLLFGPDPANHYLYRLQGRRFRRLHLYLWECEAFHWVFRDTVREMQAKRLWILYRRWRRSYRAMRLIVSDLVELYWIQDKRMHVERKISSFDDEVRELFRFKTAAPKDASLAPVFTHNPLAPCRYWRFSDYTGPGGRKIKVHLCTNNITSERVARLFQNDLVLGMDLEWAAGSPRGHIDNVCLVQIANAERIALFHVAMSNALYLKDRIPPTLRKILENRSVLKAGVGIRGDGTRLKNIFSLEVAGLFELSHLYRLLDYQRSDNIPISKRLVSLTNQAERYFGLPLPKGSVRTSKWQQSLDGEQIFYSANDAYASFMLFHTMNEKRLTLSPMPPLPRPVEDDHPILVTEDYKSDLDGEWEDNALPPDDEPRKNYLSASCENAKRPDFLNSLNLVIDGGPTAPKTIDVMLSATKLSLQFAKKWLKVSTERNITAHHLQIYYLAQKHAWGFVDISLALRIRNVNDIPRSLFSVSKVTNLRLSDRLYHSVRLTSCLSDRSGRLPQGDHVLLKPNDTDMDLARRWVHQYPKQYRQSLEAYYIWHVLQRSLDLVAITLGQSYKAAADLIFFSFTDLRMEVYWSSAQDIQRIRLVVECSCLEETETWWQKNVGNSSVMGEREENERSGNLLLNQKRPDTKMTRTFDETDMATRQKHLDMIHRNLHRESPESFLSRDLVQCQRTLRSVRTKFDEIEKRLDRVRKSLGKSSKRVKQFQSTQKLNKGQKKRPANSRLPRPSATSPPLSLTVPDATDNIPSDPDWLSTGESDMDDPDDKGWTGIVQTNTDRPRGIRKAEPRMRAPPTVSSKPSPTVDDEACGSLAGTSSEDDDSTPFIKPTQGIYIKPVAREDDKHSRRSKKVESEISRNPRSSVPRKPKSNSKKQTYPKYSPGSRS